MEGLNYTMTEYKRLTNKDWKENYDIFEDVCCDTCAEDCGECERNFNALVRLAELEDKIESGKLCDKKEIVKEILNMGKKLYEMAYHKSNAMPRLIEWIKVEYGVEVEE